MGIEKTSGVNLLLELVEARIGGIAIEGLLEIRLQNITLGVVRPGARGDIPQRLQPDVGVVQADVADLGPGQVPGPGHGADEIECVLAPGGVHGVVGVATGARRETVADHDETDIRDALDRRKGLVEQGLVDEVLVGDEPVGAARGDGADGLGVEQLLPGGEVAVKLLPCGVDLDAEVGPGLEEGRGEVLVLLDGHVGRKPGADAKVQLIVDRLDLEVFVVSGFVKGRDTLEIGPDGFPEGVGSEVGAGCHAEAHDRGGRQLGRDLQGPRGSDSVAAGAATPQGPE